MSAHPFVAARTLAAALREIRDSEDPDARRSFEFGKEEAREIGAALVLLVPESRADFPNLNKLKRKVMRARRFPNNTTPASRHLHTIALALVNGERYAMLAEEPIHCGETMLYVLLDLWQTKTKLAKLAGKP